MNNFMAKLRAISPNSLKANIDSVPQADPNQATYDQRQQQIENRTGGNIRLPSSDTKISENYKNTLMDAVKYYQSEFKVTPKADIYNDPDFLDRYSKRVQGATLTLPNQKGQYDVVLRNLTEKDEKNAEGITTDGIGYVPTHELGHALFQTLFPIYDTSSNASNGSFQAPMLSKTPEQEDARYNLNTKKLVDDAVKDIGSNKTWKQEAKKISDYATTETGETIAEALADYYYRKDKAAPLSKAIIKRLKSKGSLYGVKQTGGVDLDTSSKSFVNNLRKYSPLQ